MDGYPAAEPIPCPSLAGIQHNELIDFLTNSRDMRQTAKSSLKQAAYAGGAAMAGGFLLGPIDGLVGGIAGSIIGFLKSDDYDGAILAVCKLDAAQQQIIMQRVGQVLISAGATLQQLDSGTVFWDTLVNLASRKNVRDDLWIACIQSLQE
jgi:hypothetical protein